MPKTLTSTVTESDVTPTARGRWRATYDLVLLRVDLAERGWTQGDLARSIRRPANVVSRFLCGHNASPKLATQIAKALRQPVARYVLGVEPRRPKP